MKCSRCRRILIPLLGSALIGGAVVFGFGSRVRGLVDSLRRSETNSIASGGAGSNATESHASAAPGSGGFSVFYATVASEPSPVPEHLVAPLPHALSDFPRFWRSESGFLKPAIAEDLACAGVPRFLAELERAVSSAAKSAVSADTSEQEIGASYGRLWASCQEPGACSWARRVLDSRNPSTLKAVAYYALAACAEEGDAHRFESPAVPPSALIEYWFRAKTRPGYTPFLEHAASLLIRTGTYEQAQRAASVLASVQDRHATSALLNLQTKVGDSERVTLVGLALGRQTDPRARAAFQRACRDDPTDPECVAAAMEGMADNRSRQASSSQATSNQAPSPAELKACAERADNTDRDRYGCLERLAHVNRSFAVETVRSALTQLRKSHDPWMAELAVTLASYPTAQHLRQRLASLGLLEETITPDTDAAPIVARSLLRASGRLIGFAAETRRRPMGHDSKLRRLATRAGAPLADVIFEEVLVSRSEEREQYQIRAYFDGLRIAAELNLTDDCYDLKTMVGLLNTVARQLNANQRFAPVATNDEAAWIVFGPEPALQELVSEGLLRVSSGEHSHAHAHAGH